MNNEGTTQSLTEKLTIFFQVLWKTEPRKLRGWLCGRKIRSSETFRRAILLETDTPYGTASRN